MDGIKKYNPMKLTASERADHYEQALIEALAEIKRLRDAAHADALVIQRLSRERDEFAAIAEDAQAKLAHWVAIAEDAQACTERWIAVADDANKKLVRLNQLAASRAGRVPR